MRIASPMMLLLISPLPSLAQSASPESVLAIQARPTTNAILRVGTEVPLRLAEELTTKGKKLRVGQRFRMETSEAVKVDSVTVIPIGTPAIGEIIDVRNKGMWGKSGHFTGQARYLTVNGRQIRISGTFDDKGTAGGIGAVAVSAVVFAPAGFFMTGTSAKLTTGTPVKAFIDEDVVLEFSSQAQMPLQVTVPQTASSVASEVAPTVAPAFTTAPPAIPSLAP
jgi:hypothetical protein